MWFTESKSLVGFLAILCFSVSLNLISTANTITVNLSLSGDHTIVSEGAKFELGFFKACNSSNYYIGIWYNKHNSNPLSIVWVANRETPISDRFRSELQIIDGNWVLLNESKFQIWSTNVTTTSTFKSAIAVIHDDGNLVLSDGSNSVKPYWESFDHPTHTWFPGAKLGYNNITKKSQALISWRSNNNPAVGVFSVELYPSTKEFASKWNGSQQYWTTGAWDGKAFASVPELLRFHHSYNSTYHTNENESYFIYVYVSSDPNVLSLCAIDVSGRVQQLGWLVNTKVFDLLWIAPKTQCEVYALCGSFGSCRQPGLPFCNCLTGFKPRSESDWNQSDFSGGCVRKTDLQCRRDVEKPDFLKIPVKNMPPNNTVAFGSDAGECRTTCLNNCFCNAYSFFDNKCSVWEGDLLNLSEDDDNGIKIYVKISSKDLPHHKKRNLVTADAAVGLVGGVVSHPQTRMTETFGGG